MQLEHTFRCPLPNGLHARPASELVGVTGQFEAEVTLVNERTGADANAKSVLAIVAICVQQGDACRLHIAGDDAEKALAAIDHFVRKVLPGCDESLPPPSTGGEIVLPRMLRKSEVRRHVGVPVSRGVGRGVVVAARGLAAPAQLARESRRSLDEEQARVRRAIAAVRVGLKARLNSQPSPTEAGILRASLSIAGDLTLREKIMEQLSIGCAAGGAIIEAGGEIAAQLRDSESSYVRERAIDVEDICLQLLEQVYGKRFQAAEIELSEPSVVVAQDLPPRRLLALDRRYLKGLVLEHAGATSHTAILARSFGIPTLTGVRDACACLRVGAEAIVDADLGVVFSEIDASIQRYYEREARKGARRHERLAEHLTAPATTRDGQRLETAANVATADELGPAFEQGAEGIGLFRTEMLFMDRDAAPSEEEQRAVYSQAARVAGGRPVIIRTLDVGGDKPLPYLHLPEEANPFLGWRGVRIYPDHADLIGAQLRAIVRASAFGTVRAMIPMVCSIEEVLWVRRQISDIQAAFKGTGVAFDSAMQVGIMIETPAAAFIIDQLSEASDFFSIGTNDLMQYFMAVDRDNDQVADLYDARSPAFLRMLSKIVEEARRNDRWVGMCGEMARDRRNLPLLIGMGLDEISVAVPDVLALKAEIASLSAVECREIFKAALDCRSTAEVEGLLGARHGSIASRNLLDLELIVTDSDSDSKEEAIKEVVDAFYAARRTDDASAVEEAIWGREEIHSTAMGQGFAVPHCKTDAVLSNSIGVVRLKRPIEWDSSDGQQQVRCLIVLAIRESDKDGAHMKIFSKLARRLMHEDFRAGLLEASDSQAIMELLADTLELPK